MSLGAFVTGAYLSDGTGRRRTFLLSAVASIALTVYLFAPLNVGRGLGAQFPALVGFLAAKVSPTTAIAIFSLSAYGIMIVALLPLPEPRGRSLTSLEQPARG